MKGDIDRIVSAQDCLSRAEDCVYDDNFFYDNFFQEKCLRGQMNHQPR